MLISKLVKNMLKYLPVLVVLIATVIGVLIGRDLNPVSLDSQPKSPMPVLGEIGPCGLSNIYTSLPPKCKTFDGAFIPVPGTALYSWVTPGGK